MEFSKRQIFQTIWIVIALQLSGAQDPCLKENYMELGHLPKRSPTYRQDDIPLCDRYLSKHWYRAKDHVMSTSPPSLTYCGTLYPVWLQDPVPEDGMTETLTACQIGFSDNCAKTYEIGVKNCTSFIVYKLEPLDACSSAYCFELDGDCVNTLMENVEIFFHNMSWIEKTKADRKLYDPCVNLICSFPPADDDMLLYYIDWYADDILIKTQTVDKTSLENVILSADDLLNATKKIGTWIQCIVGVTKSEDKLPCLTSPSTLFFAGIEVLNHTLTIERQGNSTILVRPTIPFGSQTIEESGKQYTGPLDIQLSNQGTDIESNCTANGVFHQCSITIPSYTYDDRNMYDDTANWYKIYEMTVYNSDEENYYLNDYRVVLRLETNSPTGYGAKLFGGVVLPDIYINIVESVEEWKGKRCSSYIDPHLTTFDGLHYECQATGCITGKTYIFYRNSEHLQEIQVRHANCWVWPRCTCAVAVRAGQDVFIMDFCDPNGYIYFPICRDNSLKVIKESDKIYKIVFPTGTYAKVMLYYYYGSWFMNIEVYPTIADVSNTWGLCGLLDDDKTNDLRLRDESISTSNPPDDFSLSWKLSDDSNDDLLSHSQSIYDDLTSLKVYIQKLCACDNANTTCSYKKYRGCQTNIPGKEYDCVSYSSPRRKRDLELIHNIHKKEQSDTKLQRGKRRKRQVMGVSEAQDTCYKVFEQSEIYGTCLQVVPNFSNESVENCIMDLSMTGEENLTQIHLQTALGQCQTYILLNSTLRNEQTDFSEIMINLCPNNCSSNGICSGGSCTCKHGFGGSDCSFDVLSPPTITKMSNDGLCDKSEEACDDVTLYGQYFLENMGVTCYMNRQEITETEKISSQEYYTMSLEEKTLYEGYCGLVYSPSNTWVTTFHFNLSTDGTQFTETYSVYVYQSQCQIFNNDTGSVYFTLQDGYCFIDGSCIHRGESKSYDSCSQCDPDLHRYDWTYVCTSSNEMTTEITQEVQTPASQNGASSTSVSIGIATSTRVSNGPAETSPFFSATSDSKGSTLQSPATTVTLLTPKRTTTAPSATLKDTTERQFTPSSTSKTTKHQYVSTYSTTTMGPDKSTQRNPGADKNSQTSAIIGASIGSLVAVVVVITAGVLLKKKFAKRESVAAPNLGTEDFNIYPDRNTVPKDKFDPTTNLFAFSSPDEMYSRPPSATSMRKGPATVDLSRLYNSQHLNTLFTANR